MSNSSSSVRAWTGVALAVCMGAALAQGSLRPEVGRPLQAAQELVKAQHYKEALMRLRDADAVPDKSPYEIYTIERMRLSAAAGSGDAAQAAKAYEAARATGEKIAPADQQRILAALAAAFYRAHDYPRAAAWSRRALAEAGNDAALRTLLIQSLYLSGDYPQATQELLIEVQNDERVGRKPSEERLKLLLNLAQRGNDLAVYAQTLAVLIAHYPRKEYWSDALARLQRNPNFSDRLALDAYRLMLASGSMRQANDYMEMAQLAVQAGLPAEGRQVLEKGYAAGVLGKGAASDIDRQRRLRDLVTRRSDEAAREWTQRRAQAPAAKPGDEWVDLGYAQVVSGQPREGIALMEQGIARGELRHPDDARLHLAIAFWLAGDRARAQAAFKSVGGSDGSAELARLWILLIRS